MALYNGGVKAAKEGALQDALRIFKKYVKEYPGDSKAQNWYGVLCAQTGDLVNAERHMKEAGRQEPDNMMYLNN